LTTAEPDVHGPEKVAEAFQLREGLLGIYLGGNHHRGVRGFASASTRVTRGEVAPGHSVGKHSHETTGRRWSYSQLLLRGLIHSDGCRSVNTGRNSSCPRYSFVNRSDDIRQIFCDACERAGVGSADATGRVYVPRKADVELVDQFIGPKR
jgi:hypothetical protein